VSLGLNLGHLLLVDDAVLSSFRQARLHACFQIPGLATCKPFSPTRELPGHTQARKLQGLTNRERQTHTAVALRQTPCGRRSLVFALHLSYARET
jgi:hypothetical protein